MGSEVDAGGRAGKDSIHSSSFLGANWAYETFQTLTCVYNRLMACSIVYFGPERGGFEPNAPMCSISVI